MLGCGSLTQALIFQGGLSRALQASHGFLSVAVERLPSLPERVLLLVKYVGWTWGFVLLYLVCFSVQFCDKATDLVYKMPGSWICFYMRISSSIHCKANPQYPQTVG